MGTPPKPLTDHLHLINQVAHHDAALSAFGSRMTAVEGTLAHVQEKVLSLDNRVQVGFSSVESLIREGKSSQGPGISDVMRGVATGGAIVAMSAGAITMLVTSFVKPEIVELRTITTFLQEANIERAKAEKEELMALQERRREMIDEGLRKINTWNTELKRGGS